VRLGLAPAIVSTVVLPRLTDRDAARLLLGGETFDGAHAADVGLVTMAVEPGEHGAAAARIAEQLAATPRQALSATKHVLTRSLVARIDRDGPEMTALSSRLFQSDVAQARMRRHRTR
jgi:enoyl-CoA hydratase/carnithine racemase